jgi:hypothetical protein
LIELAAPARLDLGGLGSSYLVPPGQAIAGVGTIEGSIVFGAGSTLSPGAGGSLPQVSAVPEPAGLVILAAGLAAIAGTPWPVRLTSRSKSG